MSGFPYDGWGVKEEGQEEEEANWGSVSIRKEDEPPLPQPSEVRIKQEEESDNDESSAEEGEIEDDVHAPEPNTILSYNHRHQAVSHTAPHDGHSNRALSPFNDEDAPPEPVLSYNTSTPVHNSRGYRVSSPLHAQPPFDAQEPVSPVINNQHSHNPQHQNNRLRISATAAAMVTPQLQAPPPPEQAENGPAPVSAGVDGIGLFKSWRESYVDPKAACHDLLDNCFDATLHDYFNGKIRMDYFPTNGFVILNNSKKAIKRLSQTMTAYRSEKSSADAIGEYGVGLKQSVATLSHCNFVLTRSKQRVEFGVIADSLQTQTNVFLPHFSFSIENVDQLEDELKQQFTNIVNSNAQISQLIASELGKNQDVESSIQVLVERCLNMWDAEWGAQKYVFQVICCNLIHGPSKAFLQAIKDTLPKNYINVPPRGFEFYIMGKKVLFQYWQNRLVEMTKFEVNIPKDKHIKDLSDHSPWQQNGYALSIYCGFDAIRLEDKKEKLAKTCQLNIYSRQSGRLIETTPDARDMLGMISSGIDFSQGLTVIVDDAGGNLPLKPTKDGMSWTKESLGEVHKSNLFAWVGAVGTMYWKYHEAKFKAKHTDFKRKMKVAILTFVTQIEERQKQLETTSDDESLSIMKRLEDAKFSMFSDVKWTKAVSTNDRKLKIRKSSHKVVLWKGPATIFQLKDTDYSRGATSSEAEGKKAGKKPEKDRRHPAAKRRASAAGLSGTRVSPQHNSSPEHHTESSSGSEEEDLTGFIRPTKVARTVSAPGKEIRRPGSKASKIGSVTDSAYNLRALELKKELKASKNRIQELETELLHARRQIQQQRSRVHTNPDFSDTSKQALQEAKLENARLLQQKAKLEESLQRTEEERAREVSSLRFEVESLKLQLQQQQVNGMSEMYEDPVADFATSFDQH